MMSNEMFGVINIRVKVKGYLKNITENEMMEIDVKGIKTKNKITYNDNNTKHIIKINDKEIILIREGSDFVNTFVFKDKGKSTSNYFLKENNCSLDIDIDVTYIKHTDSEIVVNYIVIDSGFNYEYKIEVSDIL